VLLFAGGLALGGLLDDTGLAKTVGESLADLFGVSTLIPITRMVKSGAVLDVIGAVLCVVGVAIMAKVVGIA
jgi:di/tricarboxylate transporter